MVNRSNGSLYNLNSTQAGQIFNDAQFRSALSTTVGDTGLLNKLTSGIGTDGLRSQYSFNNQLSLDDFLSKKLVATSTSPNILMLAPDGSPTGVFQATELPEVLQRSTPVAKINGVNFSEIRAVMDVMPDSQTKFNYALESVKLSSSMLMSNGVDVYYKTVFI